MKNFYEMMQILEDEEAQKALGDQSAETSPDQDVDQQSAPEVPKIDSNETDSDLKNYMFFSNLKAIKEKVEKLLSMDVNQIDSMLEDGHDWASDHIATSKDDVEEVYNWITGENK